MEIVHERCCGVDVHKKQITACLLLTNPTGRTFKKEIAKFSTFTDDLERFVDWLKANECKDVAMESTGVYWKPVFNILEAHQIEVCLVNARHLKNVPGRKTDVKDCEWIAKLFRSGLLRASLIPSAEIRHCRELSRRVRKLTQARSSEINRLQKILEDANIKWSSVATDITGVSGIQMIRALIDGERDTDKLTEMARGTMRKKIPELKRALQGHLREHHVLLMSQILQHIDFLNTQIEELSDDIDLNLDDRREDIERLDGIPGVNKLTAQTIIIEMGGDMSAFDNSQHASSWAGLCPGNNESAGKRRSGRNTNGNPWLRQVLMQCAAAAALTKTTFLRARYERLKKRRGAKRARFAIAHRILEIAYDILKNKSEYRELGAAHYDQQDAARSRQRHVKALERLGFNVNLAPAAI